MENTDKNLDSKKDINDSLQYHDIPPVEIDDYDPTKGKLNRLDLIKEANRSAIAKNKNRLASAIVILLLGFLITNTAKYGWETDRAVEKVYASKEYSDKEKLELDRQLNKEFHDQTTNRYFPTVTLIIGYIIKEISDK
ncbi:MAG: hypothetical protein AAGE96_25485 [Cyanobacteria bacterium P01_G01_bin.19]